MSAMSDGPAPLAAAQRKQLRAKAYQLKPVVLIGQGGLSDAVVAEIDRALEDHELIKIKARVGDRDVRNEMIDSACSRLGASLVQRIGNVAVLFRQRPEELQSR